jgi:hypothetical protein
MTERNKCSNSGNSNNNNHNNNSNNKTNQSINNCLEFFLCVLYLSDLMIIELDQLIEIKFILVAFILPLIHLLWFISYGIYVCVCVCLELIDNLFELFHNNYYLDEKTTRMTARKNERKGRQTKEEQDGERKRNN